jgi:hypothetical protein
MEPQSVQDRDYQDAASSTSEDPTIREDSPAPDNPNLYDLEQKLPSELVNVRKSLGDPTKTSENYRARHILPQLTRLAFNPPARQYEHDVPVGAKCDQLDLCPDATQPIPLLRIPLHLFFELHAWNTKRNYKGVIPDLNQPVRADILLLLFTQFTRDRDCGRRFQEIMFLLHTQCCEAVENFQSPGFAHLLETQGFAYYNVRFVLHYHRSSPLSVFFEDADRRIGRLVGWEPHGEHGEQVRLRVQLAYG